MTNMIEIEITDMDYVRAAIANALAEGLSITDVWKAAEMAETAEDFDDAVNLLVSAGAGSGVKMVWVNNEWVEEK